LESQRYTKTPSTWNPSPHPSLFQRKIILDPLDPLQSVLKLPKAWIGIEKNMPKYKILASREVFYEFEIEADSKEAAEENLKELVQKEQFEKFAYDWAPLEVFDNEKA
jgi:hypothetical protein